ncbi:hypothetical protein ACSAZK_08050 [Methanosarcina sp. Mfa9]|uniref:hypothetical protein n=1 Tax=Methanosarcina sp. Mfa9 TaxID=3439063 RepID=UPI003F8521A7
MKRLYTIIFALMVLLSTAVSVEAFDQKSMTRQSSEYASASWTEVRGNTTVETSLSVSKTDDETRISVSVYTQGPNYWSSMSGSTYTQDDVFKMSKNLNSASLSDIEIEVYCWSRDETGTYTNERKTVTVKADWVGTGEISDSTTKYFSKYDDYTSKRIESYCSREAEATGSINNIDLGTSSYAWLSSSEYTYTSMEK